jgi:hypothetical protein
MSVNTMRELMFGRPARLKVFVSSQMRRRVLHSERMATVEAVESTGLATAWHWERDARAGPYCSEEVCVGNASTSDGLILLLARRLTPITRAEFEAASRNGVPCYVFMRQGSRQDAATRTFVREHQSGALVTKAFGNTSELQTEVKEALLLYAVQAVRRENVRRKG